MLTCYPTSPANSCFPFLHLQCCSHCRRDGGWGASTKYQGLEGWGGLGQGCWERAGQMDMCQARVGRPPCLPVAQGSSIAEQPGREDQSRLLACPSSPGLRDTCSKVQRRAMGWRPVCRQGRRSVLTLRFPCPCLPLKESVVAVARSPAQAPSGPECSFRELAICNCNVFCIMLEISLAFLLPTPAPNLCFNLGRNKGIKIDLSNSFSNKKFPAFVWRDKGGWGAQGGGGRKEEKALRF